MNTLKLLPVIALSFFASNSAFAANPVVRCSVAYYDQAGTVHHEGVYKQAVGELSVDDCVQIAIAVKKTTPNPVSFKFFHYNYTTGGSLKSGNDGWSMGAVIMDAKVKPAQMTYAEFVNP